MSPAVLRTLRASDLVVVLAFVLVIVLMRFVL